MVELQSEVLGVGISKIPGANGGIMKSMDQRKQDLTNAVREFEGVVEKDVHDYVKLFVAAHNSLGQGLALSWKDLKEAIKDGMHNE